MILPTNSIQNGHSGTTGTDNVEIPPVQRNRTSAGYKLSNGMELFCEANNNGLQECSKDFISKFFNTFPFVIRSENRTDDGIFKFDGQLNFEALMQFCNSSYDWKAACVAHNNLQQNCPNATFVKIFQGVLIKLCGEKSESNAENSVNFVQCLTKVFDENKNFTDELLNCAISARRRRRKRQIVETGPNGNSANHHSNHQRIETDPSEKKAILNGFCKNNQNFIECSKKVAIRGCGQETFDFLLEISQNAMNIFNPKCNLTGNVFVPEVKKRKKNNEKFVS